MTITRVPNYPYLGFDDTVYDDILISNLLKEKTWTEKFKERCEEVPYEQQCRIYDV